MAGKNDVNITVVVQIGPRRSYPVVVGLQSARLAQILECFIVKIVIERIRVSSECRLIVDVQVQPSVIIRIEEEHPPSHVGRMISNSSHHGDISEGMIPI